MIETVVVVKGTEPALLDHEHWSRRITLGDDPRAGGNLDRREPRDELGDGLGRKGCKTGMHPEEVPQRAGARERLEGRAHLGMPARDCAEDAAVKTQHLDLAARPHRGCTSRSGEQPSLAECVATPEDVQRDFLAGGSLLQHPRRAEGQDEERIRFVAFLNDRRSEWELECVEASRDQPPHGLRE